MTTPATVAADVASFVQAVTEDAMTTIGPDEFVFSLTMWGTNTNGTAAWTIYDGFGPGHDAEAKKTA